MKSLLKDACCVAGLVAMVFGGILVSRAQHRLVAPVTLDVDAEINKGSIIEVFYGLKFTGEERIPVRTGRTSYRFHLPPHLVPFRLDPTDAANAEMRIYKLTFLNNVHPVEEIFPEDLRKGDKYNLDEIGVSTNVFEMKSLTDDPQIVFPSGFSFGTRCERFLCLILKNEYCFFICVLVFLVAGLVSFEWDCC